MNNETMAVTLPVLPIKRTVLFPGIMMPLTVGRGRSIAAIEASIKTEDKTILVVAQRDPQTEEPGLEELYTIGTKAMLKQIGRSEDGTIQALVQGLERVALLKVEQTQPFLLVQARRLDHPADQGTEVQALHRAIQELVADLPRLIQAPGIQEAAMAFGNEDNPVALAYRLASLLNLTVHDEQKLLESSSVIELLRSLYASLSKEKFRDGYFPDQWAGIKQCFEKLKVDIDPHLIFTHRREDRHQDHRTISDLTWNTWRRHLILEYDIPKYDGDLGLPNVFNPLSQETCNRKARMICEAFRSEANKGWLSEDTFLALARLRGIECAAPDKYAEAFYGRKLVLGL